MAKPSSIEDMSAALDTVIPVLEAEAAQVDANGVWPARSLEAVRQAGLLGVTLPAEHGGKGAGLRDFAAVTEKLASACASTAMIYLMHVCGAQVIAASACPERKRWLESIVTGGRVATLAFSERGSRSHFWAPVSRAVASDGGAALDCDKSFVTSAGHADYYVVSAGAIGAATPVESTLYLVQKDAAGLQVQGAWNGLGLRGNASAPMTLRQCRVDGSHRLTAEGKGFDTMMAVALPWFQIGSAAVSLGIAEAAAAGAVRHTSGARLEHLGESLAAAVPGIRARLARMRLQIDSARGYLGQALTEIERGGPGAMLGILGVKAVAGETALEVTDSAMRACGGAAFGRQLTVERNFRDARAAAVMAPTTEVLHDFIGKAVAGLPLF
jgi:alkylation response protein AidB-like acyl-CoA dehydrogenase